MTVYLDVIFVENILMNFIILFATGVALKINMKQIRLIFSSIIGSIYAIITYLQIIPLVSNFIMKILLSIVMIYVAFSAKNLKVLFKRLLMFYLISFIFGGCAFALLYFVKPQNVFMKNGVFVGEYPLRIALLSGIVGFIIIQIAFKFLVNKISRQNMFCTIAIQMQNKQLEVKAMIDSGNLLKEPVTNMPVIVVEKDRLYQIFPSEILDNIEKIIGGENEIDFGNASMINYLSKIRVVPFSSLGKQNGMLLGIKVDQINVTNTDGEEIIAKGIVGIYDAKLSKNGSYSALVGLDIFERSQNNEHIANIKM